MLCASPLLDYLRIFFAYYAHACDSFDEVHFGKFAGRYIKTRYFVDVHPPLAKLLITAAAFLFGFDGDFDFKDIGKWVFCLLRF